MEESEISTAIHKRHMLRFWYDGGERVVEPYAFGVGDGGHPLLRAYQVSGYSTSREKGWKLFRVDEIENLTVLEDTFAGPRRGYLRNDPTMTLIYAEL
jgi:predicted DNA-binding transcriptional regulator YafY